MNTYAENIIENKQHILPSIKPGKAPAFYFQDNRPQTVLQKKLVNDLAIQQKSKSDLTASIAVKTETGGVVQLKKSKKGKKKKKKKNYQKPHDIKVGTEVTVTSNTFSAGFPVRQGTQGIVESFSKTSKTTLIKLNGGSETINVSTRDLMESGNYEFKSNKTALDQRLKKLGTQQHSMNKNQFAKYPHLLVKAQRLVHQLNQAPLTINIKVSDLAKYTSPQILNGFEVAQLRGDNEGVGNISGEKLKKRHYYEHQLFGFPYPYDDIPHDVDLPATKDKWQAGHMGKSMLDERRITKHGVTPSLRPRYGALDFRHSGRGATPNTQYYGLSYIQLKNAVKTNCTFSLGDTWDLDLEQRPGAIPLLVTAGNLDLILLKMIETDHPGIADLEKIENKKVAEISKYMDDETYIEAQIHQSIDFGKDVERIFLSRQELEEKYGHEFKGDVKSAIACVDPSKQWSSHVQISLIS